jgi:ribose/xylose/arabinose/galactoside ABC-type transport system permease subunit
MNDVGKILVTVGLALVVIGGLIWFSGKLNLPLGRLPGDFRIERGSFKFYFPLATCLLISAVLTLVMWLLHRK